MRPDNAFILSAFDREQWCPVLEARFHVDDLAGLAAILGEQADDPAFERQYTLDERELRAVTERFAVAFDPTSLGERPLDICLERQHRLSRAPYLIHTGYELPLLLDGRKKLARMTHEYPPATFPGEERFDHWVGAGVLHRVEMIEPFAEPIQGIDGMRTISYTPIGEEWRIPAMELLFKAAGMSGGWNEHFERLEGMLFGYADIENDWWIEAGRREGGVGGIALCCAVDAAGLAWIEAAGRKALPPATRPTLRLRPYNHEAACDCLLEDENAACVVGFNVLGKHVAEMLDLSGSGPWNIPSDRIPELNRHIRGALFLVARDGASESMAS